MRALSWTWLVFWTKNRFNVDSQLKFLYKVAKRTELVELELEENGQK